MRAVVLAGGRGTRLRPYTTVIPKPLMPIGDYPILEIVIFQLAEQGFGRVTLAVNHQADLIKAFFGNGKKWGIEIDYSMETKPLGTIGPLRLIKDLPESFIMMNGDVLTDLNFKDFLRNHEKSEALLTVACANRASKFDYGVLEADSQGRVTRFEEKPVSQYKTNMGIYAINQSVLDLIPENEAFGFDNLINKLLSMKSKKVSMAVHESYWRDIGKPEDYEQALDEFEKIKTNLIKTKQPAINRSST